LQMLVEHLQFVEVKELMLFGRIPKISLEMEKDILKKLSSCDKLKHLKIHLILLIYGMYLLYISI
jgi:hypothetical protein